MWLIDSSIGRKVVMSVTGAALILFLTFHMAMNCVELRGPYLGRGLQCHLRIPGS